MEAQAFIFAYICAEEMSCDIYIYNIIIFI